MTYKARDCSVCGAQIIAFTEVHEAEGELVELGSRRSGAKGPAQVDKEDFYREMKWEQRRKGYASGWCWHQFQERFKGEHPPRWFETLTPREPSLATRSWLKSCAIAFAHRRSA